jgi:hypothetical protein
MSAQETLPTFAEISKRVGFKHPPIPIPRKIDEVTGANMELILKWMRFCPSPKSQREGVMLSVVWQRFQKLRRRYV